MSNNTSVTPNGSLVGKAHRFYNVGDRVSIALPLELAGDTVVVIDDMSGGGETAYWEILFWTDDTMTTLAAPTAGTVLIEGAMSEHKFWRTIVDGAFNSVDANLNTRPIPRGYGPMRHARITISSATDVATHFTATCDKY